MRLILKCIEYIIENVYVCLANFDSYLILLLEMCT